MAELRLALHPRALQHLLVDIIKRRGGWPIEQLQLTLTDATDAAYRCHMCRRYLETGKLANSAKW